MSLAVIIAATNKPSLQEVIDNFCNYRHLINEVVVVDFDSQNPSFNMLDVESLEPKYSFVKYYFVEDQQYFNKSIALNLGASVCSEKYVLFCDADVKVSAEFIKEIEKEIETDFAGRILTPEYVIESADGRIRPAPGICALSMQSFKKVEGFSSDYKGWGLEDMDFISRLEMIGVNIRRSGSAIHMSHEDTERVKNYHADSVAKMREANRQKYEQNKQLKIVQGTLNRDIQNLSYREL